MFFFHKIQNKSYSWKRRFSFLVALGITFILALFWFGSRIPKAVENVDSGANNINIVSDIGGPMQEVKSKFGELFFEIKTLFSNFSNNEGSQEELKMDTEVTSTTSSSTDLVQ